MGASEPPGPIYNFYLSYFGIFDPEDRGYETMKTVRNLDTLDYFCPIGFETTTVVMHPDTGDETYETVGNKGRDFTSDKGLLAFHAPSRDHGVAFTQLAEKVRDIGRIVLAIAVHAYHDLPSGV